MKCGGCVKKYSDCGDSGALVCWDNDNELFPIGDHFQGNNGCDSWSYSSLENSRKLLLN